MKRRLAQFFKRIGVDDTPILEMHEDYQKGWYAGVVIGRDSQRKADLQVAEKLLAPINSRKVG